MHFNNILVTTDFSEDSYSAFEFAAYQAKMDGSKISLVSIIEEWEVPEVLLREIPDPESVTNYRKEIRKKAEEKLQELIAEQFHGQEVVTAVLSSSDPAAKQICDFATENGCGLIVIASHGRGALGNMLLGSVVSKVIKGSPCPVLVIPKKES